MGLAFGRASAQEERLSAQVATLSREKEELDAQVAKWERKNRKLRTRSAKLQQDKAALSAEQTRVQAGWDLESMLLRKEKCLSHQRQLVIDALRSGKKELESRCERARRLEETTLVLARVALEAVCRPFFNLVAFHLERMANDGERRIHVFEPRLVPYDDVTVREDCERMRGYVIRFNDRLHNVDSDALWLVLTGYRDTYLGLNAENDKLLNFAMKWFKVVLGETRYCISDSNLQESSPVRVSRPRQEVRSYSGRR